MINAISAVSDLPGQYNFQVKRRSDHSFELEFLDSNSSPMSLAGYTVDAEVWNQSRTTKYADFDVTYIDIPNGRIRLALTDIVTTDLPTTSYYDVLLINPSGEREYYLEGTITSTEGFTT